MSKPIIQKRQINKVKVTLTFDQLNKMSTISSKTIADVFEKNHFHIMRDIRNFPDFDSRFTASKIGCSKYKDISGKSNDMFILDRSTAIILIMGFTGKKAHKFKVTLLETFDRLEQKVADLKEKAIEKERKRHKKELERLTKTKGFNELNDKGFLKDIITGSYGRASNSKYSKLAGLWVQYATQSVNGLFDSEYYNLDIESIRAEIDLLDKKPNQVISWKLIQEKYSKA